jgi:hypothetical protein
MVSPGAWMLGWRLEIPIRPIEADDEWLAGSRCKKIGWGRQRWNDLLFSGRRPEDDALVAGGSEG